jgi:hypothetical protein
MGKSCIWYCREFGAEFVFRGILEQEFTESNEEGQAA